MTRDRPSRRWIYRISARRAIPIVTGILHGQGRMVCLVKPFFEVPDSEMRRTGVIEDPGVYREVLADLATS